ncbi:MAG: polyprenyl synthetase family protein [Proteobacteria bacterium]|nr:polyprenyl synthetase family protein [Pseudomonadota bacterium]
MLHASQIVLDPIKQLRNDFKNGLQQVDNLILDSVSTNEPLVQTIAKTLISAGGKRIRPLLCLASGQLVGTLNQNSIYLAAAVELIHVATLLHDDVVDESPLRRGQQTANMIWGNKPSILVGDFLFAKAFQLMVKTENIQFLDILSNASSKISEGEVTQLRCFNALDLSVESYLEITEHKTATLFSAACNTGAMAAGADKSTAYKISQFGKFFGLMYQIIDDINDYITTNRGKSQGDDYQEGKVTLPVLLAFQDDPDKAFWHQCFSSDNQPPFEQALERLHKFDSFRKCRAIAKIYGKQAQECLQPIANDISYLMQALVESSL